MHSVSAEATPGPSGSIAESHASVVAVSTEPGELPQPNFDTDFHSEQLTNNEPELTVQPENMDVAHNNSISGSLPTDLFEPIYPGSNLTICGAYFSIMHFCHKNKLTFTATDNLLELITLFCPDNNKIPSSFYKFRKFFQQFSGAHEKQSYCFECETPTNASSCSTPNCSSSCGVGHMVHLSIEKSLQVVITSKHSLGNFYKE